MFFSLKNVFLIFPPVHFVCKGKRKIVQCAFKNEQDIQTLFTKHLSVNQEFVPTSSADRSADLLCSATRVRITLSILSRIVVEPYRTANVPKRLQLKKVTI